MIAKKDFKLMNDMSCRWENFLSARKKRAFEFNEKKNPNWLSMIDRENMLAEFVKIFQKIRNRIDYE